MLFVSGAWANNGIEITGEPDSVKATSVKTNASTMSEQTLKQNASAREDNQEYGAGPAATIQSLMLPGWGLYSCSRGPTRKAYFLLTPLSYGLIIYGFGQKIKSNKQYKEYQNTKDQKTMDDALEKAYDARQSFLNCVGAGVGIYVFQVGTTYIWGRYNDIYRARANDWKQNVAFNVAPYYDWTSKSCKINTSIGFTFNNTKKREFKNPF
jgi:hypothetical protein